MSDWPQRGCCFWHTTSDCSSTKWCKKSKRLVVVANSLTHTSVQIQFTKTGVMHLLFKVLLHNYYSLLKRLALVWLHTKLTGRINRHIIHWHSFCCAAGCDDQESEAWQKPAHWIHYFQSVVHRGFTHLTKAILSGEKYQANFQQLLVIQERRGVILCFQHLSCTEAHWEMLQERIKSYASSEVWRLP